MRRFIFSLLLLCLPLPASAWEFTAGLPCVLTYEEGALEVELTHDPTAPLYTMSLRRAEPWPATGVFSITFDGGFTISTNRQVLSDSGRMLTVADRGFGNVILGMATTPFATARLGEAEARFSLADAEGPARALEDCAPQAGA